MKIFFPSFKAKEKVIGYIHSFKINSLFLCFQFVYNTAITQSSEISDKLQRAYTPSFYLTIDIQQLQNKIGEFKIGDSTIFNTNKDKKKINIQGVIKEMPIRYRILFYPKNKNKNKSISKEESVIQRQSEQFTILLTPGKTTIIADDRKGRKWRISNPNNLQISFQNYFDTLLDLESIRPARSQDFEEYRDSIAFNFLIPQFNRNKSNPIGAIIAPVLIGYLSKEQDCIFVDSLYTMLDAKVKATSSIKRIIEGIRSGCNPDGKSAQNFILKDIEEKYISLTSFDGKYVLVDIWASWCIPCRLQHPDLKNLYQKYNKLGFEIISVSEDTKRTKWIEAVQKDQLNWSQVSLIDVDKDTLDKFYTDYYHTVIPSNFLISPKGIILDHNLNPEDLSKKLFSIFGF